MTEDAGTRWIALAGATSLHLAVGLALFFAMSSGVPVRGKSDDGSGRLLTVSLAPFDRPRDLPGKVGTEGNGLGSNDAEHPALTEPRGEVTTKLTAGMTGQVHSPDHAQSSESEASSSTADLPTAEILAYRARLQAHLARYRSYPTDARLTRQQGAVVLDLFMDRDGRVIDVWVESSSGVQSIDAEALAGATRAQPLPPFPAGWPDRMSITVPVLFRLD